MNFKANILQTTQSIDVTLLFTSSLNLRVLERELQSPS